MWYSQTLGVSGLSCVWLSPIGILAFVIGFIFLICTQQASGPAQDWLNSVVAEGPGAKVWLILIFHHRWPLRILLTQDKYFERRPTSPITPERRYWCGVRTAFPNEKQHCPRDCRAWTLGGLMVRGIGRGCQVNLDAQVAFTKVRWPRSDWHFNKQISFPCEHNYGPRSYLNGVRLSLSFMYVNPRDIFCQTWPLVLRWRIKPPSDC